MSDMRYTGTVSFDPKTYLANNVKMSQGDLYAYPVNCPFGADSADVNNHEPIMTGIHNLINPDDWFPQVVMDNANLLAKRANMEFPEGKKKIFEDTYKLLNKYRQRKHAREA